MVYLLHYLHSILRLSWRNHVPNTSVLQATGSYDLINISYLMLPNWLSVQNCISGMC